MFFYYLRSAAGDKINVDLIMPLWRDMQSLPHF